MSDDVTLYKFTGTVDEFIHGCPARDLTQADVDALDPAVRVELEANVAHGKGIAVYRATKAKKGKDGEVADPTETGETDGDVRSDAAANAQNLDTPPVAPAGENTVPVLGQTVTPGVVASDHI